MLRMHICCAIDGARLDVIFNRKSNLKLTYATLKYLRNVMTNFVCQNVRQIKSKFGSPGHNSPLKHHVYCNCELMTLNLGGIEVTINEY